MSQAQVWLAVWSAALLLLGLFLGALWGWGRGAAEAREDARWERRAAMARRTHPVFRGTRGGTVMPYEPPAHEISPGAWLEVAHEWEPVHVGQALDLIRPGQAAAAFDVEAETARYAQAADEIIAWVHAASEPWTGP